MNDIFNTSLKKVKPIRLREPLAQTLGALGENSGDILEYDFIDVVKMAGHACPTVAGAWLCCQLALEKLYKNTVPVRGEISVTVYGEADEGVYGVMAQVYSFLTGAAPATGFKGLGHRFKRKDLLKFSPEIIDPEALCFQFGRLDTGQKALVKFYPRLIPFAREKAEELGRLIEPVIWEAATPEETRKFRKLWLEKVEGMLLERKGISDWLKIEIIEGT